MTNFTSRSARSSFPAELGRPTAELVRIGHPTAISLHLLGCRARWRRSAPGLSPSSIARAAVPRVRGRRVQAEAGPRQDPVDRRAQQVGQHHRQAPGSRVRRPVRRSDSAERHQGRQTRAAAKIKADAMAPETVNTIRGGLTCLPRAASVVLVKVHSPVVLDAMGGALRCVYWYKKGPSVLPSARRGPQRDRRDRFLSEIAHHASIHRMVTELRIRGLIRRGPRKPRIGVTIPSPNCRPFNRSNLCGRYWKRKVC